MVEGFIIAFEIVQHLAGGMMEQTRTARIEFRIAKFTTNGAEFRRLFSELPRLYKMVIGARQVEAPLYCLFQTGGGLIHTAHAAEGIGQFAGAGQEVGVDVRLRDGDDAHAVLLCEVEIDRQVAAWVDDEIAAMFALQRRDGLVSGMYLDGNFVRTAMLYGE